MKQPEPPDPHFPRLTEQLLPAYRFVPGHAPHPVDHPDGHSYGKSHAFWCEELDALRNDWRRSPAYCLGVDLFNYAYWWEAHEAWEPLWQCCEPGDRLKPVLQALIQIAAAHLVQFVGRERGARVLCTRASENLAGLPHGELTFGVDLVAWFHERVAPHFAAPDATAYPFLEPR